MSLRRLALAVALATPLLAASATAAPLPLDGSEGLDRSGDHLTITISDTGAHDGTYELHCHPAGGTHPHTQEACDQLDGQTRWGTDTFAPVPEGQLCTMIYGGPERAHISGTWAGRPVNADFNRTNGCETARWNKFSTVFGESKGSPKKTMVETGQG
ncbi:SSI family serine proteinase inhibitor [Streptomyces sp. NPDC026206]|uniref:SSI family serine proteinase inhibitor n=1 Tax=Streptomyces sp. NPDC026206 TaxID=3157089 RepID=UPI0033D343C3